MEQQLVRGMGGEEPMFQDGKLWSGHRLRLAHAYGIYPSAIHDAVIAHGDDGFIFCVGRHVAIYDHVHKKTSFLQRDPRTRVITAASKSPNGRILAIAERQGTQEDGTSQISILSLPAPTADGFVSTKGQQDALRVLHPLNRKLDIIGLAFTGDSKFLVSLSGEPDSTITYWKWEIDKVVASHDIKMPVSRIHVNPKNASMLSISGPKYLRVWEYNSINHTLGESPSMFPLKQEKQMNIVDHCWVLSSFLCAATDDGQVHLFEIGEQGPEHREHVDVRAVISRDEASGAKAQEREQAKVLAKMGMLSRGYKEPPPVKLNALATWSRGFVVGGDQGYLGVFKVDARAQAESFGTFRIPNENAHIWQMCSGSEDTHLTILSYIEQEVQVDPHAPVAPPSGGQNASNTARRASATRGSMDAASLAAMAAAFQPTYEKVWSLSTFPVGQADLAATGQLEVFAPVYPLGTHHGAITSMSRPNCRRIVATCGSDMFLKVWGYPNVNKPDAVWTSEMSFPVSTYEKPKSCAVHPLGFQVAIVIEDLLRIYHLTAQSMIQTLFDLPLKHPGDVCYSNSGHMLAVTAEKDVILIDPWRQSLIHMFSGHGGHLSTVNQVIFSEDDQCLLSCGAAPHGAIYGWALETDAKERVFEHISKGTSYTCMGHDLSTHLVAACTGDGNLCVIEHLSSTANTIAADRGAAYTTLFLSVPLGALFAGTEQGMVRIFRWPMADGGAGANPFIEVSLHAHGITQLQVSYDLRLLITACQGGAVMACEIDSVKEGEETKSTEEQLHGKHIRYRHREDGPAKRKPNKEDDRKIAELQKKLYSGQVVAANRTTLDEMIMVPKQYLNERLSEIKDLEERMRNLQNENEYALEQKDQETQEKLNHIGMARKNERKAGEEKYDALFVQHTKALERHEEHMSSASGMFNSRTRELQDQFDERISKEIAKERKLLKQIETEDAKHKAQLADLEKKYEDQLTELRKTQEKALRDWRDEHEKVCNLLKSDGLKFEEALGQQEKEYEAEIAEMLNQKRVALQVESEKSTTALKDGVSMKQTISMLQKQRKERDEELYKAQADNNNLVKKLNQTKAMFEDVKEQLRESERGLKVKDQNLERLREQMKHLESFRFVLFHKVRALEDERDPLEEQVNALKANVGDMYTEFVREFRQKQQLDQQLTDKSELSKALQNENVKMRAMLAQLKKDGRRLIQEVETVLHAEDSETFEKMPTMLRQVLEKHQGLVQWQAPKDDTPENYVDPFADATKESSIIEEMVIQRDLLFRKNQIAVGAASQSKRECATDVRRLTAENAQLISEMNTLRNERKAWQRSCKELEAQLMALNSQSATRGPKGAGSSDGMAQSASAPSLAGKSPSGPGGTQRRSKHAGGVADTPYVRRKVVDQQDVFRRNQQKGKNQLPPVTQPQNGATMQMSSSVHPKPTAQEKRFTQSLESVQAGRQQMERQGFDMGSLSNAAQAMSGFGRTQGGADLPLTHPPGAPVAEADGGEPTSFAAAQEIQAG